MHSSDQGENQRWLQARRMPVFGYLLPVRVIVALVLIPLLSSRLLTQNPKPTEYDVKAAYLFNFGKFVTWPQKNYGPGDSFLVCVMGKDPFGPILDKTTAGETINGKKVIDKRISRPQDAVGCSVRIYQQLGRAAPRQDPRNRRGTSRSYGKRHVGLCGTRRHDPIRGG